jgi:hypothetical protein
MSHCDVATFTSNSNYESETESFHGSISLRRRRAEYFHRPPVWGCFDSAETDSTVSSDQAFSHPRMEEHGRDCYCCQCEFHDCKWHFGSRSSSTWPISYIPRSSSEAEISGYEKQLRLMNTIWVEEPLIVNMAYVHSRENVSHKEVGSSVVSEGLSSCQSSILLCILTRLGKS